MKHTQRISNRPCVNWNWNWFYSRRSVCLCNAQCAFIMESNLLSSSLLFVHQFLCTLPFWYWSPIQWWNSINWTISFYSRYKQNCWQEKFSISHHEIDLVFDFRWKLNISHVSVEHVVCVWIILHFFWLNRQPHGLYKINGIKPERKYDLKIIWPNRPHTFEQTSKRNSIRCFTTIFPVTCLNFKKYFCI